jgi:hypothetical protein
MFHASHQTSLLYGKNTIFWRNVNGSIFCAPARFTYRYVLWVPAQRFALPGYDSARQTTTPRVMSADSPRCFWDSPSSVGRTWQPEKRLTHEPPRAMDCRVRSRALHSSGREGNDAVPEPSVAGLPVTTGNGGSCEPQPRGMNWGTNRCASCCCCRWGRCINCGPRSQRGNGSIHKGV